MRKIGIVTLLGVMIWLILVVLFFGTFRKAGASPLEPSEAAKLFGVLPLIFGLGSLGALGVWLYSLVHLLRNRSLRDGERVLWVLIIVILNLLCSILYFFLAPVPQVGQQGHGRGEA
jgi:hypothetical protein